MSSENLGLGAALCAMLSAGLAIVLITGVGVASKTILVFDYITYAAASILAVHFIGFGFPVWSGTPYTKRFPKYLDYAYLLLLAIGLLNVLSFAPGYYT